MADGHGALIVDDLEVESSRYLRPEEALALLADSPDPERAASPRETRDLRSLLRINTAINSIRGLAALDRPLFELIFEIVPADRGAVLLKTAGGGDTQVFLTFDRSADAGEFRISRAIVNTVIEESTAALCAGVVSRQMPANPGNPGADDTPRSVLCAPMSVFGQVTGAIYLETVSSVRFDEENLRALTVVAGVVGMALENLRHIERLERENEHLRAQIDVEHDMIGGGAALKAVTRFIGKVASTDATVLIEGESGTGKELVARAIHRNSPRSGGPFVAINCAAITETLLESELFGYEKGAFTGAAARKPGKLEVADRGTLFLDEVGDLPPALQPKLLRVLQQREFERVGGTRTLTVDIRVIAATNASLDAAVTAGRFRRDLFYRLNVLSLTMPPLRERRDDIPELVSHFISKYARASGRRVAGIDPGAEQLLVNYDWPGNIRELENVVERALVLGSADRVLAEDLPEAVLESSHSSSAPLAAFHDAVRQTKKDLILAAVDQAGGSYAEAARRLGLHPNYLHRLIRNLGIKSRLTS